MIDKKFAFMIFGAILILAGAIYGYAQAPAIFGHSFEELEGAQARVTGDCSAGSSIRGIAVDGTVTCEEDTDTDTDTQDLSINGNTLSLQRGGSVTLPSSGSSICTHGSLTYTVGAVCTTSCYETGGQGTGIFYSRKHRCQSSGSWLDQGIHVGCGPECGGG